MTPSSLGLTPLDRFDGPAPEVPTFTVVVAVKVPLMGVLAPDSARLAGRLDPLGGAVFGAAVMAARSAPGGCPLTVGDNVLDGPANDWRPSSLRVRMTPSCLGLTLKVPLTGRLGDADLLRAGLRFDRTERLRTIQ